MTDPVAPASVAPPLVEPHPVETELAMPRRSGGRVVLLVLGLILIVGLVLYWLAGGSQLTRMHGLQTMQQHQDAVDAPPADTPFDAGRVTELSTQIEQLRQRVDTLEQRVAALSAPKAAVSPPLSGTPIPAGDAVAAALSARMDALAGRQDELAAAGTGYADRLHTDEARLEAAANQAATVSALTDRAAKLARVQSAQAALAQGLPLGELPDAPPALARFHSEAPPTEARLRLAFPAIAAAARAAARPDTAKLGFWRAMRARLEALITIRRGDTLLVGNSQVGIIDQARTALDAGDLAGTVAILGSLDGPAAAAFADWRSRAESLLEARAALAKLAAAS